LTVGRTKRCTCVSIWVPPRMRRNALGGGGVTYFKLGVGWCSYDASTEGHFLIFDPALWSVAPHTFSLVQPCVNNYTVVYTHKQYSIQYSYSLRWGGGGLMGFWASKSLSWPIFWWWHFALPSVSLVFLWCRKGGDMGQGGGGGDEWRLENKDSRRAGPAKCNKTPHKSLKTATGPKAVVQKWVYRWFCAYIVFTEWKNVNVEYDII
jgi:hypothetical protein